MKFKKRRRLTFDKITVQTFALSLEIQLSNFPFSEMDSTRGSETKNVHLEFFPKNEFELLFDDKLRVTWFEPSFSQSRYGNKSEGCGSNACTLIVVLLATKCHLDNIQVEVVPVNLTRKCDSRCYRCTVRKSASTHIWWSRWPKAFCRVTKFTTP